MSKGVIVIIVVLLSIVGLGFFQYKQLETGAVAGSSLSALSSAFSASLSSADADTAEINELLALLGQVSVLDRFNTELFDRPDYVILKDFSVTLFPAKSLGRVNPFLGIDEGVVVPKSAAQSTPSGASSSSSSAPTPSSTGNSTTSSSVSSSSSASSSVASDSAPVDAFISQNSSGQSQVDQSATTETDPAVLFSQVQAPSDATSSVEPQAPAVTTSSGGLKLGSGGGTCLSNYSDAEALELPIDVVSTLDFDC